MDQSISFYTEVFGMHLIQKKDYPAGRFTFASLGYDNGDDSLIELSQKWGVDELCQSALELSETLSIEVDDATHVCDNSKYVKGEVLMSQGLRTNCDEEAFVKDPDGYIIHVIEKRH